MLQFTIQNIVDCTCLSFFHIFAHVCRCRSMYLCHLYALPVPVPDDRRQHRIIMHHVSNLSTQKHTHTHTRTNTQTQIQKYKLKRWRKGRRNWLEKIIFWINADIWTTRNCKLHIWCVNVARFQWTYRRGAEAKN